MGRGARRWTEGQGARCSRPSRLFRRPAAYCVSYAPKAAGRREEAGQRNEEGGGKGKDSSSLPPVVKTNVPWAELSGGIKLNTNTKGRTRPPTPKHRISDAPSVFQGPKPAATKATYLSCVMRYKAGGGARWVSSFTGRSAPRVLTAHHSEHSSLTPRTPSTRGRELSGRGALPACAGALKGRLKTAA